MTTAAELLESLEAAAAELEDLAVEMGAGGGRTWSRGGTAFALLTAAGVDLRIGAVIGEAALRTPDTHPSARGPDWVAFAPTVLDDHARDRLEAWFAAAHRRATRGS